MTFSGAADVSGVLVVRAWYDRGVVRCRLTSAYLHRVDEPEHGKTAVTGEQLCAAVGRWLAELARDGRAAEQVRAAGEPGPLGGGAPMDGPEL